MKYSVIDLFCGCGGFSKGFEKAGFEVKFGIDFWKDAIITYRENFPHAVAMNEDITNITSEQILEVTGLQKNNIDVIIGGPPCQGFSLLLSGKLNEA